VKDSVFCFALSALCTLFLVHAARMGLGMGLDKDFGLPQKLHAVPVPRYGGLGIVLALWVGLTLSGLLAGGGQVEPLVLLACAMPAFLVGLFHDLTNRVEPRGRLAATVVSAGLAVWLLDAVVWRVDVPGLDWLLSWPVLAVAATLLAVAGIANAVNIIDGLNGLASMCVVIMLAAAAYVSQEVGDPLVGKLALAGMGAVLGFFLWNFPAGLIFLGDGGAYFLGFFVAEVLLLLVVRNEAVSPVFPLLVCIYPVFETLFSAYRRHVLRAAAPTLPDGVHLHSLVYRRLMRWAVGNKSAKSLARRNSMSSPYLWLLCSASVVPAVWFWDNTAWQLGFLVLFCVTYLYLYWRIVRFDSPNWLRFGRTRPPPALPGDNPET
jgi:UDP-N-acetylmuramyl pentapeptide phosphotransferase/UDP-N-acetylglucosamine-1-phosphate transferase